MDANGREWDVTESARLSVADWGGAIGSGTVVQPGAK